MIAILIVCLLREPCLTCVDVDLIEVNTYGPYAAVQVIAWEWNPSYRRHDVVAWRYCPDVMDYPRRVGRFWQCQFGNRTIRASKLIETRTRHDPERCNLRLHPEAFRRAIRR